MTPGGTIGAPSGERRKKVAGWGSVIEISALLALAHAAQGDIPLALASLECALTLAEPEVMSVSL